MKAFWYSVIRHIFNIITYGLFRMKVYGRERIPEKGAFIVAANHASYFDPPLLGTAMSTRLIHFMAKEELFKNPLMGRFLRYVHTFPVRRGHLDRKAIIEAGMCSVFILKERLKTRENSDVSTKGWRPWLCEPRYLSYRQPLPILVPCRKKAAPCVWHSENS